MLGMPLPALIERWKRGCRPIFHWMYSGVFIPLFFGTGVTMALASRFSMAYVSFALFGIWSVGYWLTSDWLQKKRIALSKRRVKKDAHRFAAEMRKYCAWEWGVCLVIVAATGALVAWTNHEVKQQAQDDTYAKLSFSAGNENEPLSSFFTLTNDSTHDLGKHSVLATPNMIAGNSGTTAIEAQNIGKGLGVHFECPGFKDSLGANGDKQTYECLHNIIMVAGVDCVDITLNLSYELTEQAGVQRRKDFRFVSARNDSFVWHPQPVANPANYCASYVKPGANGLTYPHGND